MGGGMFNVLNVCLTFPPLKSPPPPAPPDRGRLTSFLLDGAAWSLLNVPNALKSQRERLEKLNSGVLCVFCYYYDLFIYIFILEIRLQSQGRTFIVLFFYLLWFEKEAGSIRYNLFSAFDLILISA